MSGIAGKFDVTGLQQLNAAVSRLANVDSTQILTAMGSLIEQQTKDRIETQKQSPTYGAWDDWSPGYEATRHGNHSLLRNNGDLLDSIQYTVTGGEAEIGTNLIYAKTHQFGDEDRNIPERRFLGVSENDLFNLQVALDDWADDLLREVL